MATRENRSMGFVDGMLRELGGPRTEELLRRLDASTPWEELAAPVRRLKAYTAHGPGRRPWCPVVMIKCLMLAKWFGLSDPGLEEALQDRISFRRFIGLSFTDATPDQTTFVRFRDRLRQAGLHDAIFRAVVTHLESQGLLLREGTMVDATLIEAPRGRPRPDGTSTRDPEASFTSRRYRSYHGFKGHLAVDRSGIVTDYRFGTAKEHDSRRFESLTAGEHLAVLADSAYDDAACRARLRARGVLDLICFRRPSNRPLRAWEESHNRTMTLLRCRVEHPNAMIKHLMGHRRVRYRGIERNGFDFAMLLTAANLRRALSLPRVA